MSLTPINQTLAQSTKGEPKPEIGMGATILLHSDRHAATIVEFEEKEDGTLLVAVQRDRSRVVKGSSHDGSAAYEFTRDPRGHIDYFRRRMQDASWHEVTLNAKTKRWSKAAASHGLRIGERDEYYDPHI